MRSFSQPLLTAPEVRERLRATVRAEVRAVLVELLDAVDRRAAPSRPRTPRQPDPSVDRFLADCCDGDGRTRTTELYAAYRGWAESQGYELLSNVWFGRELHRRGIAVLKSNGKRFYPVTLHRTVEAVVPPAGQVATVVFEGTPIRTMSIEGQQVWNARDVGRALDYSADGRSLVTRISGRWSNEFHEGIELEFIRAQVPENRQGTESVPSQISMDYGSAEQFGDRPKGRTLVERHCRPSGRAQVPEKCEVTDSVTPVVSGGYDDGRGTGNAGTSTGSAPLWLTLSGITQVCAKGGKPLCVEFRRYIARTLQPLRQFMAEREPLPGGRRRIEDRRP